MLPCIQFAHYSCAETVRPCTMLMLMLPQLLLLLALSPAPAVSSAGGEKTTGAAPMAMAPIRRHNTYGAHRPFPTVQFRVELRHGHGMPLQTEELLLDLSSDVATMPCNASVPPPSSAALHCEAPLCKEADGTCGACSRTGCSHKHRLCQVQVKPNSNATVPVWVERVALSVSASGAAAAAVAPHVAFACAGDGAAGMGRGPLSLATQLLSSLRLPRKFALCLPGSRSPGVALFGNATYVLGGGTGTGTGTGMGIDVSQRMRYAPLLPWARAPGGQYAVEVSSVWVDDRAVAADFSKPRTCVVSSSERYTALETGLYRAVRGAFLRAAASRNLSRVAPVAPFDACFSAGNVQMLVTGPRVPTLDLVLHNNRTAWTVSGFGAVVHPRPDVMCMALLPAMPDAPAPIVLGSHQMEDTLVQFDLDASLLAFSPSLLAFRASCADFHMHAAVGLVSN